MIKHSLQHSLKVIFFIFVVLFSFNLIKDIYRFEKIAAGMLATGNFQPILAGLIGLIPGCGTSVVIATLYTQGILNFGGALAGLSVAAGDTILVLLANKISSKELLRIVLITFSFGVAAGYLFPAILNVLGI